MGEWKLMACEDTPRNRAFIWIQKYFEDGEKCHECKYLYQEFEEGHVYYSECMCNDDPNDCPALPDELIIGLTMTNNNTSTETGSDMSDESIDAGARNAYAKIHKTNGPYTLKEYASKEYMDAQYEMASYVIEGYLNHTKTSTVQAQISLLKNEKELLLKRANELAVENRNLRSKLYTQINKAVREALKRVHDEYYDKGNLYELCDILAAIYEDFDNE